MLGEWVVVAAWLRWGAASHPLASYALDERLSRVILLRHLLAD